MSNEDWGWFAGENAMVGFSSQEDAFKNATSYGNDIDWDLFRFTKLQFINPETYFDAIRMEQHLLDRLKLQHIYPSVDYPTLSTQAQNRLNEWVKVYLHSGPYVAQHELTHEHMVNLYNAGWLKTGLIKGVWYKPTEKLNTFREGTIALDDEESWRCSAMGQTIYASSYHIARSSVEFHVSQKLEVA